MLLHLVSQFFTLSLYWPHLEDEEEPGRGESGECRASPDWTVCGAVNFGARTPNLSGDADKVKKTFPCVESAIEF